MPRPDAMSGSMEEIVDRTSGPLPPERTSAPASPAESTEPPPVGQILSTGYEDQGSHAPPPPAEAPQPDYTAGSSEESPQFAEPSPAPAEMPPGASTDTTRRLEGEIPEPEVRPTRPIPHQVLFGENGEAGHTVEPEAEPANVDDSTPPEESERGNAWDDDNYQKLGALRGKLAEEKRAKPAPHHLVEEHHAAKADRAAGQGEPAEGPPASYTDEVAGSTVMVDPAKGATPVKLGKDFSRYVEEGTSAPAPSASAEVATSFTDDLPPMSAPKDRAAAAWEKANGRPATTPDELARVDNLAAIIRSRQEQAPPQAEPSTQSGPPELETAPEPALPYEHMRRVSDQTAPLLEGGAQSQPTEPTTTPVPEGINRLLDESGYPGGALSPKYQVLKDRLSEAGRSVHDPAKQAQFADAVEGLFAYYAHVQNLRQKADQDRQSQLNKEMYDLYREEHPSTDTGGVRPQSAAADQAHYTAEAEKRVPAKVQAEEEISDAIMDRLLNSQTLRPATDEEIRQYILQHAPEGQKAKIFSPEEMARARQAIEEQRSNQLLVELKRIGDSKNLDKLLDSRFASLTKGGGPTAEELVDRSALGLPLDELEPVAPDIKEKGFFGRLAGWLNNRGKAGEAALTLGETALAVGEAIRKVSWDRIPAEYRDTVKRAIEKSRDYGVRTINEIVAKTVTNEKFMKGAGFATGAAISAAALLRVPSEAQQRIAFDLQNTIYLWGLGALAEGVAENRTSEAAENERRNPTASIKIRSFAQGLSTSMMVGSWVAAARMGAGIGSEVAHDLYTPPAEAPNTVIIGPDGGGSTVETVPETPEQRFSHFGFQISGPAEGDTSWHEIQTNLEPGGSYADATGTHWEAPIVVKKEEIMDNTMVKLERQFGHDLGSVNPGDSISTADLPPEQSSVIAHSLALIAGTNNYAEYQQIAGQIPLAV